MASKKFPARLATCGSVERVLRSLALLVILSCLIGVCYHRLIAPSSPDAAPYTFNSSAAVRDRPSTTSSDSLPLKNLTDLHSTAAVRDRPPTINTLPLKNLTDSCVTAMRDAHFSPPNGTTVRGGPALTPPQERAAAACRAELRNVLQQWAAEARRKEAEAVDQAAESPEQPSPHAQLTREAHSPADSRADSPDTRRTADSTTSGANGGTSTLSNTRSHLVEAALFARATNRTLVLPKASRSRLSLAHALPLCAYFDLSRLDAHWISPDLFLLLARAALTPPFAASAAKAGPSVAFVHLQTSQVWRMTFTQGPLVDMVSELMVYGMGHPPSRRNTVDVVLPASSSAVLQQLHQWRHRDVMVWVKTTYDRVAFHRPTDDISFEMLPYSREWHAMAQQAIARLPPQYIAVHYRSEFIAFHLAHKLVRRGFKVEAGVLDELMTGCMEAARDLINGMKRRHNISAVFIAADVPFDDKAGSVVRSDSWRDTTWMFQGRERVLEATREKLRWLREQVTGTVMVDELLPAVNQYDPGIVAILDKLLCAHADMFLAGSITCGGSRGFEQDIRQHRSQFNKTLLHRWVSQTDKLLHQSNSSSATVG
ncbi:unnamed protein product [Closterium sp. Yama58-4]|nr:unnamed protein product [Closterium sp. Yama58-4]